MAVTWGELYNTPEFRKHFLSLAAAQVLILIVICLLAALLFFRISLSADERIYGALAGVEKIYPGSSGEIIPLFTDNPDPSDIAAGRILAEPYGYVSASFLAKPLIISQLPGFAVAMALLFIFSLMLNLIINYLFQRGLFGRIADLTSCITANLDGRSVPAEGQNREGLFDYMILRFNQLVGKLDGAAEKLNEEKLFLRNIISDISHQLKTPLASLIMFNDLLSEDPHMPLPSRVEFLRTSRGQLGRMEWLIKSLLKLARLETGSIDFHMKPCNIREPLERALENLSHLSKKSQVMISDERERTRPFSCDKDWFCEALANILKNGFEHAPPEDGRIRIRISETALFLRLEIEDNGEGIGEAELPRIFDRFYKGGHSVNMENVGIGLPLSRMIIEAHGGDIRARSAPGRGAAFIITFPY